MFDRRRIMPYLVWFVGNTIWPIRNRQKGSLSKCGVNGGVRQTESLLPRLATDAEAYRYRILKVRPQNNLFERRPDLCAVSAGCRVLCLN